MKHWDQLKEIANDNYGLVTFSEAKEVCVADVELTRWAKKGWLDKRGWGVYRLADFPIDEKSRFAEAVALCGGGVLYGEAVLALNNLALVNPGKLKVAINRKFRRKVPGWVEPIQVKEVQATAYYGIPSQRLSDAIRSCIKTVPKDRLISAVDEAEREGLIFGEELNTLRKEMNV